MIVFVIAGRIDCVHFTHAIFVAEHLSSHLPSVRIKKIEKLADDWQDWLKEVNAKNRWYHSKSPIIWKEVSRMGGKPYLIGSLSEFWEYCYDYYDLQSFMSKSDLLKLVADNLMIFQRNAEKASKNFIVSIIGGSILCLRFLLHEIQNLPIDQKILIRLLDVTDVGKGQQLDLNEIQNVVVVDNLKEAIVDCDLLLVLDDEQRSEEQELNEWLERRFVTKRLIADKINHLAKRTLRIIVSNNGPVCFDASVLVLFCTSIRIANIVAITADVGFSALNLISNRADITIEEMGAPPVWGFIGMKSFVDVKSIITKADVYRPYLRAVTSKKGSTLSSGTIKHELRFVSYIFDDDLDEEIDNRQMDLRNTLGRPPILPKIRAISSLLKLWYAGDCGDDIISLGVCSNGSFGFTPGLVVSQPVILNEKKLWRPFSNFPVTESTKQIVLDQLESLKDILEEFGIGIDPIDPDKSLDESTMKQQSIDESSFFDHFTTIIDSCSIYDDSAVVDKSATIDFSQPIPLVESFNAIVDSCSVYDDSAVVDQSAAVTYHPPPVETFNAIVDSCSVYDDDSKVVDNSAAVDKSEVASRPVSPKNSVDTCCN